MIDVRSVSKTFKSKAGDVQALDQVDLVVKKEEFCCLLGRSGCGKSTLLSMIAGLQAPSSGGVFVNGRAVRKPGPDRAVVFQESGLFPWRTSLGNVEFGLEMAGMGREERRRRAMEMLRIVSLQEFARSYPYQLSGGMRQRVNLARALAVDPAVLLMDEPFGAVDALTRVDLQEHLIRVWGRSKTTILFVTHSVEEAIFLADRIIVFTARPGRIAAEFTVELPRPRDRSSMSFAKLRAAVTQSISAQGDGHRGEPSAAATGSHVG